MKMLSCLVVYSLLIQQFAWAQATITKEVDQASKTNHYELPASEEGLPGEGALRRYDAYVKKWNSIRPVWATRKEQDAGGVVFLGDSITAGWGENFKDQFKGMKAVNRGIGGDTTRGILIRMEDDVLKLKPKAVVLLIGTNDLETGLEPEVIGRNMKLILSKIKEADPKVPVVLCQVFPSSEKKKRPAEQIKKINEIYAALVKGDSQVTLVDTWTLFAQADGNCEPAYFPDLLHLNEAGYKRWGAALRPVLATLGFLETEADTFQLEEGYVSLFNGKDLTGWKFLPQAAPKNPKPNAPFFPEFKEEIKFDGQHQSVDGRYRAINGRLVVATPSEGRRIQQLWTTQEFGKDFTLKLEFRATPNADSGVFIRKPQLQCRDFPLAGPYKTLKNFKTGDWNELEVVVRGESARATCNGEVLEEAMKVPSTGPIGLEGDRGQMEYRRLRVKMD